MRVTFIVRMLGVFILCVQVCDTYGQEEQVAFLPGIFELTNMQRAKADVLHEYAEGFYKALLYKRFDTYLLRIEFKKREGKSLEEFPISVTDLESLREQLQLSLFNSSSQEIEGKSANGRGYLITSTSLHAITQSRIFSNLSYEFETIPGPFSPRQSRERSRLGKALPYFATAGAITSSILLTRDKHIQPSAANMHFWGSLFGYWHGFLLTSMIRDPYRIFDDQRLESVLLPGTSILEGWLGYQIAKRHNFSYARTKAINSGNFWGGIQGLMIYGMIEQKNNHTHGPSGFSGLIGSGIGLFAADRLYQKYPRSSGDISAINMAGIIGLSWGGTLGVAADFEDKLEFYGFFTGIAGGLLLSGLSTKNTNFTKTEGGLIVVSSIAGGALGVGLANFLDATDGGYALAAAAGMTVGWITSYQIFSRRKIRLKSLGFGGKIKWNFNPASIGMVMSSPEKQANLMRQNIRMDMLGINYSF